MNFYSVFQRAAFMLDPENIHDVALFAAHKTPALAKLFNPLPNDSRLQLSHNGLKWSFPVGLAAGFDKNANCIPFFEKLGFGGVEIGTITKRAQAGNPKPRIHRHPEIQSIQNAMGFPNAGSDQILSNLKKSNNTNICIGSNIGKNKDTSDQATPAEYKYLYEMFAPFSQYITVNISSPNTPGLRSFQKKEKLLPIIEAISEAKKSRPKPTFIKIAPDMEKDDVKMLCELVKLYGLDGVVATNTTTQHDFGSGGLSGNYIKPYAQKVRKWTCEFLREDPTKTIIGVGGINCYSDLKEFWKDGGHFAQVYTSFIYRGPELLHEIRSNILSDLKDYKFNNLSELIENIKDID